MIIKEKKLLKYVSVKYLSNDLIKDDYKDKYSLFCRTCNIDNFITKYLEDDEFCIFIADIYEILYEDIMKQNKTKKNISSVKTINELIREIFISIYKFNIEKLNCTEGVSIDILFSYFIGKENNDFINKRYKEILNGNKIEDLFSRNYARILLVTDYLRFKSLKVKNDYTSINSDGLINEISILIYLMNNSNENIIKRFNSDSNFVYEMVSSFINFNINLDDKTRKKCKDTELIKKINPMCILDYDISKDR